MYAQKIPIYTMIFFLLLGIFEASYHIMNGFQYFFQILWKSRREKTPQNNFSVILCVNKKYCGSDTRKKSCYVTTHYA